MKLAPHNLFVVEVLVDLATDTVYLSRRGGALKVKKSAFTIRAADSAWPSGSRVQGSEFKVRGSGFRSGFRVQGSGLGDLIVQTRVVRGLLPPKGHVLEHLVCHLLESAFGSDQWIVTKELSPYLRSSLVHGLGK